MDGLRVSEEDDSECGGGVAILRRPRELHDQRDQVVLDAVVKVTRQAPALAGGARDPRPRELPSDIPRIDMPDRRRFREPLINTLVEGPPHTAVIALDERVDVASCRHRSGETVGRDSPPVAARPVGDALLTRVCVSL
jgi:hypothetical protein